MALNDSHLLMIFSKHWTTNRNATFRNIKTVFLKIVNKTVFWHFQTFSDVQSNLIFLFAYLKNTRTTNFIYLFACKIIDISTSRNLNKWTCHRLYKHLSRLIHIYFYARFLCILSHQTYSIYSHLHLMERLSSHEDMMTLANVDEKSSKVIFSHGIWRVV